MGIVFRGEDPVLARPVALKVIRPRIASPMARERFLREARLAASLKTDHVASIYQVDQEKDVPFMAMELLEGQSLESCLKRMGKLPLTEVLRVGRDLALGLTAAHKKGLIHRDIKPANIWLESTDNPLPRVKVLDFGLARENSQPGVTQIGTLVGTPGFMAPEQIRGEVVTESCDLFSLGCVLYTSATGVPPFKAKDSVGLLIATTLQTPTPPRELDPTIPLPLNDLILNLLAKEPAARPASAASVAQTLAAIQSPAPVAPATVVIPAPEEASPPRRPRSWAMALVALLILGVVIGLGAVIHLKTAAGDEFVVETDDPDLSFKVNKDVVTLEDSKTGRKYAMKAVRRDKTDEYELEVSDVGGDLVWQTKSFTLKRGEKVIGKVRLASKEPAPKLPVELSAWIKKVSTLSAKDQVEAVAAKLKELNDGFDGKFAEVRFRKENDKEAVDSLQIVTNDVGDLRPLQALKDLKSLVLLGKASEKGHGIFDHCKFRDLSALKDLRLTKLHCVRTQVKDLSPLKDMQSLTDLTCGISPLTDLTPLKDLKGLTNVNLLHTPVSDLTPLKGMRLKLLFLLGTKVTDLSPLQGMPLELLILQQATEVSDLTPLNGMESLRQLSIVYTKVADLSPLKGLKLVQLDCHATKVTDLSPLGGMPMERLTCDFQAERDAKVLRAIKSLQTINGKPAAEFWKDVDAGKPATKATTPEDQRRIVEWVLSLGGSVTVNGRWIKSIEDLPKEPWQVEAVNFLGNKNVNDENVKELQGAGVLNYLHLSQTAITDKGLAVLAKNNKVVNLGLNSCPGITDEGLRHVASIEGIKVVELFGMKITPQGIEALGKSKSLRGLSLRGTSCNDACLEKLAALTNLEVLDLGILRKAVTSEGRKHLAKLTKLQILRLDITESL
jgi:serine/threonine protein kinase